MARPSLREKMRAWVPAFVPAAVAVVLVRQVALGDEIGHVGPLGQFDGSILVREPAVAVDALLRLLRSLLVPWPHNALITRTEVGTDATTFLAVSALAALAVWAALRSHRSAGITAALWIAAFAVPSLFVPSEGMVVAAERYAYIPSVGAAILIGALIGARGPLRGVTPAASSGRGVRPRFCAGDSFGGTGTGVGERRIDHGGRGADVSAVGAGPPDARRGAGGRAPPGRGHSKLPASGIAGSPVGTAAEQVRPDAHARRRPHACRQCVPTRGRG